MSESVTIVLPPESVRILNEIKSEKDTYEEVITRLLQYISDSENYVTEEERLEILEAIAESETEGYYTADEVDKILDNNSE